MEKWGCADKAGMEALRSEARERFEAAKRTRTVEVFGSDRDERVLRLAAAHRAQAGLNGFVRLERKDLREAQVPVPRGAIVTNPPTASASGTRRRRARFARSSARCCAGARTGR